MLDRAVLAGGVDSLEDDQDAMLALGPEAVLEVRQPGEPKLELLGGGLLGVPVGCRRIDAGELDPRPGTYPECLPEVAGLSDHRL